MADAGRNGTAVTLGGLRPKQRRIIELVAKGMKNREIAQEVGNTEYGVKNRLRAIYDELGLSNRLELALWYVHKTET